MGVENTRIATITPPWVPTPPPVDGGGTKAVVDILVRGLQKDDHKVVLFAAGYSYCSVPVRYRFDEALGTGREDSEVL